MASPKTFSQLAGKQPFSAFKAATPKPFFKRGPGGTTRIVRDNYGGDTAWFALCAEVKKRDNYCCTSCGEKENKKEKIYHQVHHVRELSHGGLTVMANLTTLCKGCHKRKHKHLR